MGGKKGRRRKGTRWDICQSSLKKIFWVTPIMGVPSDVMQ